MSRPTASNGDHVCEECGHDSDEHSYNGCDYYTPEWPRLVRCSCTGEAAGGITP